MSIFSHEMELYLREKVSLGNKVMQDLNDMIPNTTPNLQQDLTDTIVDVFNLVEALHYHIDIHRTISDKIAEARIENAKLLQKNAELKKQLRDVESKLARALEE